MVQTTTDTQPFASDAPLFYNVGIWGDRGYAVPNFGLNQFSVNESINDFVSDGGRRLSMIMHHPDTGRGDPPSINTIVRMVQFMNKARVLLLGRGVAENQPKFEATKIVSPRKPFKVYPFPFFKVANPCMTKFAATGLAALAELMQSTETTIPYDISSTLAAKAISYVQRFQTWIALEYFGLDTKTANDVNLDLSTIYAKYTPSAYGFVSTESIDQTGTLSWPQDTDLGVLATGILTVDLPQLGPYPYAETLTNVGAGQVASGTTNSASGTSAGGAASPPPFPTNPTFNFPTNS